MTIKRTAAPIIIDGDLNEPVWAEAEQAKNFFQQFPFDSSYAANQTVAMVTYDENNFYVAAICYDTFPGKYIIQSLKRDFSYPVTDAFAVYIDPWLDKTNGFNFSVSPLGVQREGSIDGGGGFGVTTAWDNKWFSEVKRFENRWQVEMAIPFKTLRFKKGQTQWRINFSRNDLKANENSSWVPVPRGYNIASLAFTGNLNWDAAPDKPGTNISLIPFALARADFDYEAGTSKGDWAAGGDAKIVLSPSLNLDVTALPDFSQVEVDRQVTNLSRFELFFPERRQFFIENADLFSDFGFRAIRPFFSRRIGLSSGNAIPIYGGLRLSGKVSNDLRVGFLNMQTAPNGALGLEGQNYTVGVFQQKVFNRSNVAAILVNRQTFNGAKPNFLDFSRVLGLDYNLQSKDNRWKGKLFYHHSFDDDTKKRKGAQAVWLMYNTPKVSLHYNHEWVQRNYNAEVGFVPRRQYFRFEPSGAYRFYPKKGKINNHGPEFYDSQYWNDSTWKLLDSQANLSWQFSYQNRSILRFGVQHSYTYLYFPFDPTRTGGTPLPDSVGYSYFNLFGDFSSDFRKPFNYQIAGGYGTYFNGYKGNGTATLNYRIQPWAIISLAVEYNQIDLPTGYSDANLFLISPRFEFSFSRKLFFTTFLQYNTQVQNFNINARFQWRFKPMSDLYIVLTENYHTDLFAIRNRSIVFKLNYWLNL